MRCSSALPAVSRRQALALGALGAGGWALLGAASPGNTAPADETVKLIERIVEVEGSVDNGVLSLGPERKDITGVTHHGTPIKPAFMLHGDLVFQSIGAGQVMMNADMCLKTDEVNRFIHALIEHGIIFQAEHQHVYDFTPIVWFTHFRMHGSAERVARAVKAALGVTSTPFPQHKPSKPSTPLPAEELGRIIGAKPSLKSDGIVGFNVPRANPMTLGGVHVNPYLNVDSPVEFQPLAGGKAAAFADYGMTASEIQHVVGHMQSLGWDSGCLYNQEIDEQPQLYFDHFFKTGDPVMLAREIRSGFNLMNVKFTS